MRRISGFCSAYRMTRNGMAGPQRSAKNCRSFESSPVIWAILCRGSFSCRCVTRWRELPSCKIRDEVAILRGFS